MNVYWFFSLSGDITGNKNIKALSKLLFLSVNSWFVQEAVEGQQLVAELLEEEITCFQDTNKVYGHFMSQVLTNMERKEHQRYDRNLNIFLCEIWITNFIYFSLGSSIWYSSRNGIDPNKSSHIEASKIFHSGESFPIIKYNFKCLDLTTAVWLICAWDSLNFVNSYCTAGHSKEIFLNARFISLVLRIILKKLTSHLNNFCIDHWDF